MGQALPNKGDVLAGKYEVVEVLGVGGMGIVVSATKRDSQEIVAVKFMSDESVKDAESVERFLREAKAAEKLSSLHIARVSDVGKLDNGSPYMAMEYLIGNDLATLLGDPVSKPTMKESCLYLFQACSALEEAHGKGIIHRDIKPSNLFVTRDKNDHACVKVLDFGISKLTGAGLLMTKTTAVFGSPLYMSPEQMRSARSVDARSDIWSLGATLYELLTGSPPFTASSIVDLCMKVAQDPAVPPSSHVAIPIELDSIVMRCLEKSPDKRFKSVRELAAALAPFAGQRSPSIPLAVVRHSQEGVRDSLVDPMAATSPSIRKSQKNPGALLNEPLPPIIMPAEEPPPKRKQPWLLLVAAIAVLSILGTIAYVALNR